MTNETNRLEQLIVAVCCFVFVAFIVPLYVFGALVQGIQYEVSRNK